MQQYMTGEQVARIVTMPGKAWVNYDADYIQGEFDFEVAAGSTEPMNETFRRQSALQLVDASMPFLEMGVANPHDAVHAHPAEGLRGQGRRSVHRSAAPSQQPGMEQAPPGVQPVGAPPEQGALPPGPQGPPPGMPPGMPPDMAQGPAPMPPGQMQGPAAMPPEMMMQMAQGQATDAAGDAGAADRRRCQRTFHRSC